MLLIKNRFYSLDCEKQEIKKENTMDPTAQAVQLVGEMIVRHVRVDRSRTPQEMLDATGCTQYVDKDVLATMPHGEGEEVDVYFFKRGQNTSAAELKQDMDRLGLKPDPFAQCQVNTDDPLFANRRPNGCNWGKDGWCSLMFRRYNTERIVGVESNNYGWDDYWWHAGVRK